MRATFLSAFAVLALGASAVPAAAGTLTIEYRITGGAFIQPPGSTVTGGMYTVEFDAAGRSTILPGPALLKSFSFSGFDSYLSYGDSIETSFLARLTAPAAGNGTAGSGFRNAGIAYATGPFAIHCQGRTCGQAGFTESVTEFFSLSITLSPSGISINGDAAILTGLALIPGVTSGFFSVSLTGQEVTRTFVPEPQQGWILLGALVPIAALQVFSRLRNSTRRA